MATSKLVWLGLFWGLAVGVFAQAPTSENNGRLKKALANHPAADANKDGVLTVQEAKDYKQKHLAKAKPAVTGAKQAGAPVGGETQVYKRIGELALPLYLYKPKGWAADAKLPAIVFFFGGGWRSGSPTQFEQHCKYLAERGMVAITVEYRVSSRYPVKIEDCIEDAKSAMRWVRGNAGKLGIDPQRIASSGGSAGGHLAACVALMDDFDAAGDDLAVSPKPNAMVLFNPAMALAFDDELSEAYKQRIRQASGESSRGPRETVSPLTHAAKKQPPCIMFFGTADLLLEGAELFRQRSAKADNVCRIITYADQRHSFFNYRANNPYYGKTVAEMDKFLTGLGWLKAP